MSCRFGLVANVEIKGTVDIAKQIMEYLEPEHELVLTEEVAGALDRKDHGVPLDRIDCDIIITIGGDGTILRTLQHTSAKIMGVNAGVLGFLTELPRNKLEFGLKRLVEEDYIVDERIKLKTELNGERLPDSTNEAVIHTAQIAKIQSYQVYVDDQKADRIRADGIIIATPTGSTCYAMSVGGPIVDPKVHGFVITPIAPFKLASRPLVVSSSSTVTVELEDIHKGCVLVLDGQKEYDVGAGDVIKLSESEHRAEFIRFDPDFYKRVSEKLRQQF